jgi:hypothetical protein
MALTLATLARASGLQNSGLPTPLMYTSPDSAATVEGANYFGGAAESLNAGDVILASCANGGTIDWHFYGIVSNDGTTVVIKDVFAAHA